MEESAKRCSDGVDSDDGCRDSKCPIVVTFAIVNKMVAIVPFRLSPWRIQSQIIVGLPFVVNGFTAIDYNRSTIEVRQSNINMGNGAVKGVSRLFNEIDNIIRSWRDDEATSKS